MTEQTPVILTHPNAALRRRCEPIAQMDDQTRALFAGLRAAMRANNGIGLAAPQVGALTRVFVAEAQEQPPIALANPVITHREGSVLWEEGCLSVPGVTAPVARARAVRVVGINENGDEEQVEAEGLLAVCIQHEIDHLDGVLFFDHISDFKRLRLLDKYNKARQ